MKQALIFVLVGLLSATILPAQNAAPNSYWVQLKDKKGTPYQISQPEAFLSQRSIDRRTRQHISIDETDLPVSQVYLDYTSKWLNGSTVRTADTVLIQKIAALPFVTLVQLTKPGNLIKSAQNKFADEDVRANFDPAKYGNALGQLTQLNGKYLHNQGFRGKGIKISCRNSEDLILFSKDKCSIITISFIHPSKGINVME